MRQEIPLYAYRVALARCFRQHNLLGGEALWLFTEYGMDTKCNDQIGSQETLEIFRTR